MNKQYFNKITEDIKRNLPKEYSPEYAITLASSSPRRKELLSIIEKNIQVKAVNYNEIIDKNNCSPSKTSLLLALNKAKQFFEQVTAISSRYVITADTIVYHPPHKTIIGKPQNVIEAKQMLRSHLGKTHTVSSAFVVIDLLTQQLYADFDLCTITFFKQNTRLLNLINEYIKLSPPYGPMDKAGGYGYQEDIIKDNFIKVIMGDPATIIGFPLEKFKALWHSIS